MEKRLRIEETNFKTEERSCSSYVGYQIITDTQTIKIGISDDQSCCESYGCLITNGYYGHDAVLISKQLNHEDTL